MSIKKIATFASIGLQAFPIIIEVDTSNALPTIEIIGLPDTTIKEAKERIRATFRNIGMQLPPKKIIINLSPSDIKKIGTGFDLPIATAILWYFMTDTVESKIERIVEKSLFFGELGLDGTVKGITGLLPSVLVAIQQGYRTFFVPEENCAELLCIPEITIYPLTHFRQLVEFFQEEDIPVVKTEFRSTDVTACSSKGSGFCDIKGQLFVKRALSIAAAGMHHVLMIGPPGSGKTMLARSLPDLLPPMSFEEQLEVSKIYSVVGKLTKQQPLITQRPFRAVHHTASKIAIVGGGQQLTPGEISLAHRGVLFLDELPEFPREVLEVLRQPIEDKEIIISRAQGSVQYPADFMLVAAMNPCKCGYYKDPEKSCTCSYIDIQKYQSKISGPLLDRFDMIVEVPRERIETILDQHHDDFSFLETQIDQAKRMQAKRFAHTAYTTNAQISAKDIQTLVPLSEEVRNFFVHAVKSLHISPRMLHRIQKIARTIADLAGSDQVSTQHIAEALQYRAKSYFCE